MNGGVDMFYILVFLATILTISAILGLVICEIKNKSLTLRFIFLGGIILMFFVNSIFFAEVQVFRATFSSSFASHSQQHNALIDVAKSDRNLLTGIHAYLNSGKEIPGLAAKISDLLNESSSFSHPSMFYPCYDYQKHIKVFDTLGNGLIALSKEK